jgi:hypothetical protein
MMMRKPQPHHACGVTRLFRWQQRGPNYLLGSGLSFDLPNDSTAVESGPAFCFICRVDQAHSMIATPRKPRESTAGLSLLMKGPVDASKGICGAKYTQLKYSDA